MPVNYNKQLGALTSTFEALDREDMAGKVAVVTGGNRGIGYHTVKTLARAGATVYIGCRSVRSGEEAIKEITRNDDIKGTIAVIQLDLSDFSSIKKFADQFKSKEKYLHYLILNGGIIGNPKTYTQHNFETSFGVNHMGHFYLQSLLVDIMEKQNFQSRIVVLSSNIIDFVSDLQFEDLNYRKRNFNAMLSYGQSKLCNLYIAQELAERLEKSKVLVYAVHPGAVDTEMSKHAPITGIKIIDEYIVIPLVKLLFPYILNQPFKTEDQGASTTIYACCAKEIEGHSGSYLCDCKITPPNPMLKKIEVQKKIWEVSERYVEEVQKNGKIIF